MSSSSSSRPASILDIITGTLKYSFTSFNAKI